MVVIKRLPYEMIIYFLRDIFYTGIKNVYMIDYKYSMFIYASIKLNNGMPYKGVTQQCLIVVLMLSTKNIKRIIYLL